MKCQGELYQLSVLMVYINGEWFTLLKASAMNKFICVLENWARFYLWGVVYEKFLILHCGLNDIITVFLCITFLTVEGTEIHVVSQRLQGCCQHLHQFCKGWPISRILFPAGHHHVITEVLEDLCVYVCVCVCV